MREDVTLEMVDGYLTITAAYEHGVLAVTRSTPAFRTWSLRPGVFLVARVAGR